MTIPIRNFRKMFLALLCGLNVSSLTMHAQIASTKPESSALAETGFATNVLEVTNGIPSRISLPTDPIERARMNPLAIITTNAEGKILISYDNSFTNAPVAPLRPVIEIEEEGATARNGSHTVHFNANLNTDDSVIITMPDGGLLQGHPVALSVSDAKGHRAWIGKIQDTEGKVIAEPGNQVIYTNAFDGIRADVVYTYEINSIEQDIVIRQQLTLPQQIDEETAVIECWTEFISPPEPRKTISRINLRGSGTIGQTENLADDEILDFEQMRIKPGTAFYAEAKLPIHPKPENSSRVAKRWLHEGGRTFLVETADYVSLKPNFAKLEAREVKAKAVIATHDLAYLENSKKGIAGSQKLQLLASAGTQEPGVVLDYIAINSSLLNINFCCGTYIGPAAAGKNSNDYWNDYGTCGVSADGSISNLAWSHGTNSGVSLAVQNAAGCWGNTSGNVMMDTYIYPQNLGNITLTLQHIPTAYYDLYLYGASGGIDVTNGNFLVQVDSSSLGYKHSVLHSDWTDMNWTEGEHYVVYRNFLITSNQTLTIAAMPAWNVAMINGLQLAAVGSVNTPPSISTVPDQSILSGTSTGQIGFTVSDAETPGSLTVSAVSTNTTLVPNGNIVIAGSGGNRTVTVTPTSGQTGTTRITLTVSDGSAQASTVFLVTVTQPSGGGGTTSLVTSMTPGGPVRNDHDGWVGFQFTVGSTPIVVTDLGRWVLSGNTSAHTVQLFDSSGIPIPNASVIISTAGKAASQFNYASLSNPVTLTNGHTYALMSLEEFYGDTWLDWLGTPLTLSSVANSASACYRYNSNTLFFVGGTGRSYVPVDLRYQSGGNGGNTSPTITGIPNFVINQNTAAGPAAFTIGDTETPAGNLVISSTFSNPTLISSLVFGGGGANRTVTVNPAANQSGSATITLTVTDGDGLTASTTFTVTVKLPISGFNVQFNGDHSIATVTASSQSGATVYYTTDGSVPTQSSSTAPPQIASANTVVKARAFQSGYTASDPITLSPIGTTALVTFNPTGHNPIQYSNGPLPVQMSAESGATVFYKAGTSGSWISVSSGGSPSIDGIDSGNGTIQAYAFSVNKFRSGVSTSGEFSFRLPQPTSAVQYNSSFTTGTLTFSDAVSGTTIRYTSDGSVPTTASAVYSSPLSATTSTKFYARAYKSGYIPSGHVSAWVNQLPSPRLATRAGLLTGNITYSNPVDVWLLPNFGFDNAYGESRDISGWYSGGVTWNDDAPNASFPGSLKGAVGASLYSVASVPVSYGRTYSARGWYRKEAVGGSCDYAGLFNSDDSGSYIVADDINESGFAATYLIAPLIEGATTAQVADVQSFAALPPEVYYNILTPLTNFSRTTPIQRANQGNSLSQIFQPMDYTVNPMKVTAINGNALTLQNPYHGPTLPAGTPVCRRQSGGWYQYQLFACPTILQNWTQFSATSSYMRSGTESVRLLDLLYSGTTKFTGHEFWEGTAAQRPNLYYTLNGSSSVFSQSPIAGPVKVTLDGNSQGIINVGQRGASYIDSPVVQRTITFKVAAPGVTPTLDPVTGQTTFSALTGTTGAQIRYTIDGSDPTAASILYNPSSAPILPGTVTTRWKAFKANYTASETVTVLGVPSFSPEGSTYSSGQTVTLTAPVGAQLKVFQPGINLLNPGSWVSNTQGGQTGFPANGSTTSENRIEVRRTPYGTSDKVWVGYNLDTDPGDPTGPDGGWNAPVPIDHTKLYRFSVWIRKLDQSPRTSSGYTYLGCSLYGLPNVSELTGTATDSTNLNPYFWNGLLHPNEWYLLIGYVHPSGDLGTASSGKVYNTFGNVVFDHSNSNMKDFRWLPTATNSYQRAYLYYCTEAGIQQEFWNPRVEQVDSVTDPVDVLFLPPENSPRTIALNGTGTTTIQALSYASGSIPSPVQSAQYQISVLDTDGDGLPDGWEMQYFGNVTHAGSEDYDHDGLCNVDEYGLGYDPTKRDTGNLGLSDGDKDLDSDGLSNNYEISVSHSDPKDPFSLNMRMKGQAYNRDAAYLFAAGLGDTQSDVYMHLIGTTTVNGQLNFQIRIENSRPGVDYNIYTASAVGGPWTLCYKGVTPNTTVLLPIPTSGNGFFYTGSAMDYDGDGLTDSYEVLIGTSPTFADTDGDGFSDPWEVANGYNPMQRGDVIDSDGDGLSDADELQLGTNLHLADTDGNGISDADEDLAAC